MTSDVFVGQNEHLATVDEVLLANTGVINVHGVAGSGKTWFLRHVRSRIRNGQDNSPVAFYDIERLPDHARAGRSVLIALASEFEREFKIRFPQFQLCLAVLLAREGGEVPPLVRANPTLQSLFDWFVSVAGIPLAGLPKLVENMVKGTPSLERVIRTAGGTLEVVELHRRALLNDPLLEDELIHRFVADLSASLSSVENRDPRHATIMLDSYERLWNGAEALHSAAGRELDRWVRVLSCAALQQQIILIIAGREEIQWTPDYVTEPDLSKTTVSIQLSGISAHQAEQYLVRRGIGNNSLEDLTEVPLTEAILSCCDIGLDPDRPICHPLYLALCADIVQQSGSTGETRPDASLFWGIPAEQTANALASRFLRSLNSRRMELWIEELSLTLRFNEEVALALDRDRDHNNGRAGWELLSSLSFVDGPDDDGFFKLHSIVRDSLRSRIKNSRLDVHRWFFEFWGGGKNSALHFYHYWAADPAATLSGWMQDLEEARAKGDLKSLRNLPRWWDFIPLDGEDKFTIDKELWAFTHFQAGFALVTTSQSAPHHAAVRAIAHLTAALDYFNRGTHPKEWAQIQVNLAIAFSKLSTQTHRQNLEKSIECCEHALQVLTEDDHEEWTAALQGLGVYLLELPTGHSEANIERALHCFNVSLRACSRKTHPHDWAVTKSHIAYALLHRSAGDKSRNYAAAIRCLTSSLEIIDQQANPFEWALIQNSLGSAYMQQPSGLLTDNIERAMKHIHCALTVFTEDVHPQEWAMAQNNLGITYSKSWKGGKKENIDLGIDAFNAALRVYDRETHPLEWARARMHLGAAFTEHTGMERDAAINNAIEAYSDALSVLTKEKFPQEWAMIQDNLGNTYTAHSSHRDIKKAIEHHLIALTVRTKESSPFDWAITQMNLAGTYTQLPTGNLAIDVGNAISAAEHALSVFSPTTSRRNWASTKTILGDAYLKLPSKKPKTMIGKALRSYEDALNAIQRTDDGELWAKLNTRLGNSYFNVGTTKALGRSIKCFEAALLEYDKEASPRNWANTHRSIARSYGQLSQCDDNLNFAIEHYELAISVFTMEESPVEWANTLNSLGIAYVQQCNYVKSLECFDLALQGCSESESPDTWALTHMNRSSALVMLPQGEPDQLLCEAIESIQKTVRVYEAQRDLANWTLAMPKFAAFLLMLGAVRQDMALLGQAKMVFQEVANALRSSGNSQLADLMYQRAAAIRVSSDF